MRDRDREDGDGLTDDAIRYETVAAFQDAIRRIPPPRRKHCDYSACAVRVAG